MAATSLRKNPRKPGLKTEDMLEQRRKILAKLSLTDFFRISCERCQFNAECHKLERQGKEVMCELTDKEAGVPEISENNVDYWLYEMHNPVREECDPMKLTAKETIGLVGYLPYGDPENRKRKKRRGRGVPPPKIRRAKY